MKKNRASRARRARGARKRVPLTTLSYRIAVAPRLFILGFYKKILNNFTKTCGVADLRSSDALRRETETIMANSNSLQASEGQ